MTVDVTTNEVISNTDLISADTDDVDEELPDAKSEFATDYPREDDITKTNEPDEYNTAQDALSWLTAFYVHKRRGEFDNAEMCLDEYERLLGVLGGGGEDASGDDGGGTGINADEFSGESSVATATGDRERYSSKSGPS